MFKQCDNRCQLRWYGFVPLSPLADHHPYISTMQFLLDLFSELSILRHPYFMFGDARVHGAVICQDGRGVKFPFKPCSWQEDRLLASAAWFADHEKWRSNVGQLRCNHIQPYLNNGQWIWGCLERGHATRIVVLNPYCLSLFY